MIIGISGKLYSGKDTLASCLLHEFDDYGVTFMQKSFAFKLKKMGAYLTNTPEIWWFTQEGKQQYLPKWDMTIGEFQQKLGTEAMRDNIHPDGWVIALMSEYSTFDNWIVTDVRFPNEAEAIKKEGGTLIRIEGDPSNERKNSKRDLNHPSETSLDDYDGFDYKIVNAPPIETLQKQAHTIAFNLLRSRIY